MINAWRHTLFGAGNRIGCPGQANSKYGTAFAKEVAAQIKLCGARVVRHSLVNTQSGRAPQSHARVAG
jgi:hypothetical protein